jgi:hypothetical protein
MKYRVIENHSGKVASNHKTLLCAKRASDKHNREFNERHHFNWNCVSAVFWYVQVFNSELGIWERIQDTF